MAETRRILKRQMIVMMEGIYTAHSYYIFVGRQLSFR